MSAVAAPLAFLAAAFAPPPGADRPAPAADDRGWAEGIVLRPDYLLKSGRTGTQKWVKAPTVTVVDGTQAQQAAVEAVVDDVNVALDQTPLKGMRVLPPGDKAATLVVQFLPRAKIPDRARQLGATAEQVKELKRIKAVYDGTIWNEPGKAGVIQHGVVLVSSDKADAAAVKRSVLRSVCWELGLMSTSSRRPESAFYRDGDKWADRDDLSAADRTLIVWFYTHVPAGTKEVGPLFDAHWPKDK